MANFSCAVLTILFTFISLLVLVKTKRHSKHKNNRLDPFYDLQNHEKSPLLEFSTKCGLHVREGGGDFEIKNRILGGRFTDKYELPWIVQPHVINKYRTGRGKETKTETMKCGGTLINNRYVLTAAHCCYPDDEAMETKFVVKVNGDDVNSDDPLAVEEVTVPELHDKDTLLHDICLMRLQKPITFSDTVQPICLPTDRQWATRNLTGLQVTVAGWGVASSVKHVLSPRLKKVDIVIEDTNRCIRQYSALEPVPVIVPKRHFCGGNALKDACVGDSGGPALYKSYHGSGQQYTQLGIISFGEHCAEKDIGTPGVYVKVADYIPWILDHIYE